MGALHRGHLSLIALANAQTDVSVCSIFVNPTQFNDKEDLAKYPRPVERDVALLLESGCHVLFLPDESEIYPNGTTPTETYDFGYLDKPMEGAHRLGHFAGMAQVVKRLLDIVQPDRLFMGQKDYQQFKIVERFLQITKKPIVLVCCPIFREPDGLAMSSRNVRLEPDMRKAAPAIYAALQGLQQAYSQKIPLSVARSQAIAHIEKSGILQVNYLDVVNADTLQQIENWSDAPHIVALTAVIAGKVRLLDNVIVA